MLRTPACLALLAPLAACTAAVEDAPPPAEPAVRVLGEAVSCIPLTQIQSTQVRNDRTIDFEMLGSRSYRNVLPNTCPSLRFEDGFTYSTGTSQLCSSDIIYVLDRSGGEVRRGAGCGLGRFVPVEYVRE
jgi:hypothetical protein